MRILLALLFLARAALAESERAGDFDYYVLSLSWSPNWCAAGLRIRHPPEIFRELTRPVELRADVVEEAFLQSNPNMRAGMVTITCKAHRIQEARICMTRDLDLRNCGRDVATDCGLSDALLDPIR